jgi:hypothetical protein
LYRCGWNPSSADRVRRAGQQRPPSFDFTRPFEEDANPVRRRVAEHRGGNALRVRRAKQQRVAALRIDGDGLPLLPQRRAALRFGVERQRDRFESSGGLPIGRTEYAGDGDDTWDGFGGQRLRGLRRHRAGRQADDDH